MLNAKPNWAKLILAIVICQAAGGLGALFTSTGPNSWYATLEKPSWNPPNWIFGPVWTVLYLMMGVALYLVWSKTPLERAGRMAFAWFWIQLALNVLWSAAFFGLKSPLYGYLVILALWCAIVATMWTFGRVSKTAVLWLAPYLLWVTFASCLNWSILAFNMLVPNAPRSKTLFAPTPTPETPKEPQP